MTAPVAKIDAFAHVLTAPVRAHLEQRAPAYLASPNIVARPALWDLAARREMIDRYPGYRQILTLTLPSLDEVADPPEVPELCRRSNDWLAELVAPDRQRYAGFAAEVGLPDVDFAIGEAQRAVGDLGALGVQIYTNAAGRPLDQPEFTAFFEALLALDVPIWVHPNRPRSFADYPGEEASRYGLHQKFGWPYETSVFMARMIYGGAFRRWPDLRILTHHAGGIVPHLAGRLVLHHETREMRRSWGIPEDFEADEVVDGYRRFYGDTVFSGAHHPLSCALEFFGPDRLLFATDMPYGADGGDLFIRETMAAVTEALDDPVEREVVFHGNARRVLGVEPRARRRVLASSATTPPTDPGWAPPPTGTSTT